MQRAFLRALLVLVTLVTLITTSPAAFAGPITPFVRQEIKSAAHLRTVAPRPRPALPSVPNRVIARPRLDVAIPSAPAAPRAAAKIPPANPTPGVARGSTQRRMPPTSGGSGGSRGSSGGSGASGGGGGGAAPSSNVIYVSNYPRPDGKWSTIFGPTKLRDPAISGNPAAPWDKSRWIGGDHGHIVRDGATMATDYHRTINGTVVTNTGR